MGGDVNILIIYIRITTAFIFLYCRANL